jgi:MFS family permease
MSYRKPFFLNQLPSETAVSLSRLAGIEGFSRSILVGVLPLVALKAFGDKETISSVYFVSAVITLIFTLNISILERLLSRRWLVTLGGLLLILSVLFYYTEKPLLFALGIGIRAAGASIFSVCLSLYIMDYIGKADLTRSETRRMLYTGMAWLMGPMVGSWVFANSPSYITYTVAIAASVMMLGYFWWLRLGDDAVIRPAQSPATNPLRAVRRYMSQPRLLIAYTITLSRACFWATLFVYGPIYVVEAGLPAWTGGILLSGASGFLFFSPVIQRLAERFGTRQVLITCSLLIGTSLLVLGWIGTARPLGFLFWITGALGAAGMDTLGNIPFMRMVRPRERSDMTMVFSTWREGSSLLTQALVFLTLLVAPFWVFYIVLALLQFATAAATTNLPRRL